MYLVAEAPPHHDYSDATDGPSAIERAKTANIKIHTVACSAIDRGEDVKDLEQEFGEIANATGGELFKLERSGTQDGGPTHTLVMGSNILARAHAHRDRRVHRRTGLPLVGASEAGNKT